MEIEIKDWVQRIDEMSRERLQRFAINTMGLLSTMGKYTSMTSQEIFNELYAIGEPHGENDTQDE